MKTTALLACAFAAASANALDFGRIMLVGDSNTAGVQQSHRPSFYSHRPELDALLHAGGHTYEWVGFRSETTFASGKEGRHSGIGTYRAHELLNGRATEPLNGKLSDWLADHPADTVMIFAGVNEWQDMGAGWSSTAAKRAASYAHFTTVFDGYLDTIYAANPNALVFLGSYHKGETSFWGHADFFAQIAQVAQEQVAAHQLLGRNVHYLPLYEESLLTSGYTYDGIHWSDFGRSWSSGIMYDTMMESVPEPATIVLLAGAGLFWARRRP